MICVRSFISTRIFDKSSIGDDVDFVVQEATKGMQGWIETCCTEVLSTSTQLVANDRFASYAITVVAKQVRWKE